MHFVNKKDPNRSEATENRFMLRWTESWMTNLTDTDEDDEDDEDDTVTQVGWIQVRRCRLMTVYMCVCVF